RTCQGPQIKNFVDASRDRLGDHLEISERDPSRRRFRGRILFRGADEQSAASRHRDENGPHRQKHPQHNCLERHLRWTWRQQILKGVDLSIGPGEVHAIMGPNGSGKSTLAAVLAGREGYEITEGQVLYQGRDLLDMDPEERAREGVFLAFQYPIEIPGVNSAY